MPEDPVQILQKAIARCGDDCQASTLVAPARRVVEVCDAGDKVSRDVLKADSQATATKFHAPLVNTMSAFTPCADDALSMERMEDARAKLEAALPQFTDVFGKLDVLEESRRRGEESFSALLRRLAVAAGLPKSAAASVTLGDIESMDKAMDAFGSACNDMGAALEALGNSDALATESAAAKRGEAPPNWFKGLGEIVKEKSAQAARLSMEKVRLDQAYCESGFETKNPMEAWGDFLKEVSATRTAALALHGAGQDDVLGDWGLGLEESSNLPDGYRMLDTREAIFAARNLLKAKAKDFSDIVAAADAAQPPFDKIDASSINVSGAFPSKLAVGRIDSFPAKHGDALRDCEMQKTMPRCIDFPFTAPIIYKDADLLYMLILRMAQALPQGLFDIFALDSENVGQTFREIAGLRKFGIMTVSSKRDDDERILSELDSWLGDLSDRGCWDDSADWADFNRNHPEAPLPFKLVLFPSLTALDASQMATVTKLVKNGVASGMVAAFSKAALDSMSERDKESAAKDLLERAGKFVLLDDALAEQHEGL